MTVRLTVVAALLVACLVSLSPAFAQPGPGRGRGGPGRDADFAADRDMFHELLEHRADIRRDVKEIPQGVETLTESDRPEVAAVIQKHVSSMEKRVKEGRPIHLRDPLFAELFRHASKVKFTYQATDNGMHVRETSEDPYVAKLIQAHAKVVSAFLKNGFDEVHRNHPLPDKR